MFKLGDLLYHKNNNSQQMIIIKQSNTNYEVYHIFSHDLPFRNYLRLSSVMDVEYSNQNYILITDIFRDAFL